MSILSKRFVRPRIGFISHAPHLAGAERMFAALLRHRDNDQLEPIAFFPEATGPIKDEVKDLGIPVISLPYGMTLPTFVSNAALRSGDLLKISNILADCFTSLELDGIVVNTTTLLPALLAAAKTNIPSILHSHGLILGSNFPMLDKLRWMQEIELQLSLANKVLTCSQYVADYYVDVFGIPTQKTTTFYNATEIPNWTPLSKTQDPNFVMLTTLEEHKGVITFLRAAKIVEKKAPHARFLVYGDGHPTYKQELEHFVSSSRLKNVEFRPKQRNVAPIYLSASLAVVASHVEPFSLITIEAMAAGRPVISTRCGGPEEIISDGKDGWLIDVDDDEAMAEKMLELLANQDLLIDAGAAARETAVSFYDIRKRGKDYSALISGIVLECRENCHREYAYARANLFEQFLQSEMEKSQCSYPELSPLDVFPIGQSSEAEKMLKGQLDHVYELIKSKNRLQDKTFGEHEG